MKQNHIGRVSAFITPSLNPPADAVLSQYLLKCHCPYLRYVVTRPHPSACRLDFSKSSIGIPHNNLPF